ncbi:MAG: chromosomal replication initiator protein DnaA [Patescibacteria group bacterium]
MEQKTLDETWQDILGDLSSKVPKPSIKTWFNQVKPLAKVNDTLKLTVPNKIVKFWLEQKFNSFILSSTKSIFNEVKSIEYIIEDNTQSPKTRSTKNFSLFKKISIFEVNPQTNINPKYRFDNFVVGGNNELAFAAAQGISQDIGAKYNPLFIHGSVGLGKTHLIQAIGNEVLKKHNNAKKIKYTTSEQFTNGLINALKNQSIDDFKSKFRDIDVLIIDDVQFFSGKVKSQEELFHTFNVLYDEGKQIIFSSDRPPVVIPDIEDRLKSRFSGGLVVDIIIPDFETRVAILRSKSQERGVLIDNKILDIIAQKITRNIRELEGALNLILFKIKDVNKLTEDKINELLKDYLQVYYRNVTPKKIVKTITEFYSLKEDDMVKKTRKKEVIRPRQIAMYLLRDLGKMSYTSIGEFFNNRDHTTIIYSCEKIEKEVIHNLDLTQEIEIIKSKILHS